MAVHGGGPGAKVGLIDDIGEGSDWPFSGGSNMTTQTDPQLNPSPAASPYRGWCAKRQASKPRSIASSTAWTAPCRKRFQHDRLSSNNSSLGWVVGPVSWKKSAMVQFCRLIGGHDWVRSRADWDDRRVRRNPPCRLYLMSCRRAYERDQRESSYNRTLCVEQSTLYRLAKPATTSPHGRGELTHKQSLSPRAGRLTAVPDQSTG